MGCNQEKQFHDAGWVNPLVAAKTRHCRICGVAQVDQSDRKLFFGQLLFSKLS
jgi:hypothetical protein